MSNTDVISVDTRKPITKCNQVGNYEYTICRPHLLNKKSKKLPTLQIQE